MHKNITDTDSNCYHWTTELTLQIGWRHFFSIIFIWPARTENKREQFHSVRIPESTLTKFLTINSRIFQLPTDGVTERRCPTIMTDVVARYTTVFHLQSWRGGTQHRHCNIHTALNIFQYFDYFAKLLQEFCSYYKIQITFRNASQIQSTFITRATC